jgi:hypothetical protein
VRKDGVPLNVFEVEAALERKEATGSSFPENSLYELVPGAAAESALDLELRDAEQEAVALFARVELCQECVAGLATGLEGPPTPPASPPPPLLAPRAPLAPTWRRCAGTSISGCCTPIR